MPPDPRNGWIPCGYGCGKLFRPWAGTKLIGHALCAISDADQDALLAELEADPRITQAAAAAARGVSIGVLRAWLEAALQRRRAR